MKRIVLAAAAVVMLSGLGLSASAQAQSYGHRHVVTPAERAAIAHSQARLAGLKAHARADGKVSVWERMRINAAQARHNALVARYRHN